MRFLSIYAGRSFEETIRAQHPRPWKMIIMTCTAKSQRLPRVIHGGIGGDARENDGTREDVQYCDMVLVSFTVVDTFSNPEEWV